MRVSIFGLGYVGAVSGACLAELGHQVVGVDTNSTKVDMVNAGEAPIVEELIGELTKSAVASGRLRATLDAEEAVRESDISLVSVGTPTAPDGGPMLGAVDAVVGTIGELWRKHGGEHAVVIRSTIPPGCTESRLKPILEDKAGCALGKDLHLTFNPEFLREGRSVRDFREPPFTIVGAENKAGHDFVARMYESIDAPRIDTSIGVAESIKILSNAYHATKIAFANEAGRLLKSVGVDSRAAMEVFCQDNQLNISKAYLRPGFAFGGSCLPKDLRAILSLANAGNVDLPLMRSVLATNRVHIDDAVEMIRRRNKQRKVAMLGLSFKPGTDDLRESPLVTLAERLIGKGYELRIVDEFVQASRLMGKNKDFIESEIPHFAEMLVTDVSGTLDWAETIVVGHVAAADRQSLLAAAKGKTVIDLAGVSELEGAAGVDYEGICW